MTHPGPGEPGWDAWLGARLAIERLPSVWPECDARCAAEPHDPDSLMVLADLEIERAAHRGGQWWNYHSRTEIERDPEWAALGVADQTATQRLPRSTRLRRVATTDRMWDVLYNPGTPVFEDLYEILDGPLAGGQLVAVSFGPSDIGPGLAGKLVVQDHPPA